MENEKELLVVIGLNHDILGVADNEQDAEKIFKTFYPKVGYSIYRRVELQLKKVYGEKQRFI